MKIGFGTDIHRLKEGIPLILGGVIIPAPFGTVAHSDGDVLIHAICDAIYGALNIGDIGTFFPDSNTSIASSPSTPFLEHALEKLNEHHQMIINIDTVIILEKPKLSPYIASIKKNLVSLLKTNSISIKAKTNEGIGDIGKQKAIASYVTLLVDDMRK